MKKKIIFMAGVALLFACGRDAKKTDIQNIAKEAYLYAYPIVKQYEAMYKHAIDRNSEEYYAPINNLSFKETMPGQMLAKLWLDLRTDAYLLHIPELDERYQLSVQMSDLYANNFHSMSAEEGCKASTTLLLGRNNDLVAPGKADKTISTRTDFVCVLIELSTHAEDALFRDVLGKIQVVPIRNITAGYKTDDVDFPPYSDVLSEGRFFGYLNFLLQFCEIDPEDEPLLTRFAKIGIGPGCTAMHNTLSETEQLAVQRGMMAGEELINTLHKRLQ